ncbi:MAG: hypothetical protein ACJATW_002118, partial [Glaciecola sp.]
VNVGRLEIVARRSVQEKLLEEAGKRPS